MDDSQKRINGDVDVSKKSSVPSRYHQVMTSEDEAQSSSAQSSGDEEQEEGEEKEEKSITSTKIISPPQVKREAPVSPAPTSQVCDLSPKHD